jgi:hypothetical protein
MVKVSTLFYVLEEIEGKSGTIHNFDDYQEEEETEYTDIMEWLGRLELEVDQVVVDKLISLLPDLRES